MVPILDHTPYSPDLSHPDYFLFLKMKIELKGFIMPTLNNLKKL